MFRNVRFAIPRPLVWIFLSLSVWSCSPSSRSELASELSGATEGPYVRREIESRTAGGLRRRTVEYHADQLLVIVPTGQLSLAGRPSLSPRQALFSAEDLRVEVEEKLRAKSIRRLGNGELENVFVLEGIEVDPLDYGQSPGGGILVAEPNYLLELDQQVTRQLGAPGSYVDPSYPGDALFPQQWSLDNQGQTSGLPDADIDALEAWQIERGDPGVVIAIIDTGVDHTHRDLRSQMWVNPGEIAGNGVDDDGNGYVDDVHGYDFWSDASSAWDDHTHGTHTAGIAAAAWRGQTGIVGVAPDCRVMALKAFSAGGHGSVASVSEAVLYAAAMGARVTNNSYGFEESSEVLRLAFEHAHAAGVVSVASAGNSSQSIERYPASFDVVLSVGSTDKNDQPSWFTNYGPRVDLAAPGESVLSTVPAFQDPSGYAVFSGTSMAAPHVAGVAGLLCAHDPQASVDAIQSALRSSVDPIPSELELGTGRINAAVALRYRHNPDLIARVRTEPGSDSIPVYGTAAGTDFHHYELQAGLGAYPTSWTTLHSGHAVVVDGFLGEVSIDSLPSGLSRIRVRVLDSAGRGVFDSTPALIDNFRFTQPQDYDVLRPGELLELFGGVGIEGLTSYSVDWRPYTLDGFGFQVFTGPWSTAGIVPTQNANGQVYFGPLGTFDTGVVASERCLLRLRGSGVQELEESIHLYLDPTLKPGWPVRIEHDRAYLGAASVLDPLVADLDGDGHFEVYSQATGRLHALAIDGTARPGFPLELPKVAGEIYSTTGLTLGDVDGDGRGEILTGSVREDRIQIHAFDAAGQSPPGFPLGFQYDGSQGAAEILPYSSIVVADVDADGQDELVYQAFDLLVIAETDGSLLPGGLVHLRPGAGALCPRPGLATKIDPTPAVANLDSDPELEIVVFHQAPSCGQAGGQGQGQVLAFNPDGTLLPGWPRFTAYPPAGASPAIGDLDLDGANEIVVAAGASGWRGGLHVFQTSGELRPGWPQYETSSGFTCSPTLVDLNGDGDLEIVIGAHEHDYTFFFEDSGAPYGPGILYGEASPYAIGATDVDQDGLPDLTSTANALPNGAGTLLPQGASAWNAQGLVLPGFPRVTESNAWVPLLVADLDGDGLAEGISSSFKDVGSGYWSGEDHKRRGSLYVWELAWPMRAGAESLWPTFHGNLQRTGFFE